LVLSFGAMALLASVTRPNKQMAVAGEQFATIDEGSIRYQMAGNGERVVLFLHGFNANLNMWDSSWAQLDRCPVRRLRIDVPGFGASHFETENFGLEAQADRLDAMLEALEIEKATVVGGSMGGSLAVALAARHPKRVEQLALLAPSGYPGALHHSGLFGLVIKPGLVRRAAHWLAGTPVYKTIFPNSVALQATTVAKSYGPAWLQQLKNTQAPAFVAWSKSDRTARADTATKVVDALPDGTLFWLDESAGHGFPVTRPEFVAEVACLMGQGVSAHDVAGRLPTSALLTGGGGDMATTSLSIE
jgi:pimeloyl-ACP methyl ester carboxylesterase